MKKSSVRMSPLVPPRIAIYAVSPTRHQLKAARGVTIEMLKDSQEFDAMVYLSIGGLAKVGYFSRPGAESAPEMPP